MVTGWYRYAFAPVAGNKVKKLKLFTLFPVSFLFAPAFREQIRFVHESLSEQLALAAGSKIRFRREQVSL